MDERAHPEERLPGREVFWKRGHRTSSVFRIVLPSLILLSLLSLIFFRARLQRRSFIFSVQPCPNSARRVSHRLGWTMYVTSSLHPGGLASNVFTQPYALGISLCSIFMIFIVELIAFRWGTAKLAKLGIVHGTCDPRCPFSLTILFNVPLIGLLSLHRSAWPRPPWRRTCGAWA